MNIIANILVALCLAATAGAQPLQLTDMPSGKEAVPGFGDPYLRYRPALSINGFDCEAAGANCDHGLGLKQILESVAGDAQEIERRRFFDALAHLAAKSPVLPSERGDVVKNAFIAEADAFAALVTLVLEENGISPAGFGLPEHNQAVEALKNVLFQPAFTRFDGELSDDAVKWAGPLASLARAADLYLALEKAYLHYGRSDASLFSCEGKGSILLHFEEQIRAVTDFGNKSVIDLDFIKILGIDIAALWKDIGYDEVQAGNWPLKVHTAVGYAAMGQQIPSTETCTTLLPAGEYDHWIRRALGSAGGPDSRDRNHHWRFQTNGGRRFWAEGPYYMDYALVSALPFWHAVRAQGLLDFHPDFSIDDPFKASWFVEPVLGYLDLTTPEGGTPPLEDGNKIPMSAAFLLRWNDGYGDGSIGEKAAWIAEAQGVMPSEGLWMNALALPLAERVEPPAATVFDDESPLVLRRDGGSGACDRIPEERVGPCHYVLLNGESTGSIRPGEGHEQSDQMQLIYYVDDTSYLVDSGYDSAPGILNSTWSDYRHHNVMTVDRLGQEGGHGGLPGAEPGLSCKRRISTFLGDLIVPVPCMFADHNAIEKWRYERYGSLDVAESAVTISPAFVEGGNEAAYQRTLIFVDDPAVPYLVDINGAQVKDPSRAGAVRFTMQYYGNAGLSNVDPSASSILWNPLWAAPDSVGRQPESGENGLFMQAFAVEDDYSIEIRPEIIREPYIEGLETGEGVKVNELALSDLKQDTVLAPSHTTVAFIVPQPAGTGSSEVNVNAMRPALADGSRDAQVFLWRRDMDTMDALIVRAASASKAEPIAVTVDDGDAAPWAIDEAFQTPGIVYDAGTLRLNPGVSFGFLRLSRSAGTAGERLGEVEFALLPNRPNPFRDRTMIRFSIPGAMPVRIEVFDVLGRQVSLLADSVMTAGWHDLVWEASGISPGTYFCRLEAGGRVMVRQMTVR